MLDHPIETEECILILLSCFFAIGVNVASSNVPCCLHFLCLFLCLCAVCVLCVTSTALHLISLLPYISFTPFFFQSLFPHLLLRILLLLFVFLFLLPLLFSGHSHHLLSHLPGGGPRQDRAGATRRISSISYSRNHYCCGLGEEFDGYVGRRKENVSECVGSERVLRKGDLGER